MDDAFNAEGTRTDPEPRDFYVYAHRDSQGKIFYIGKGTGRRAWSQDRHHVWHRYVQERLNRTYSVEIIQDGLTESEAEAREGELISEFGSQLVNWQNSGRSFDYAALEKYHALRGENLLFVAATRPVEASDVSAAVDRYRQALSKLREYESLVLETGIVAELSGDLKTGDLNILNRLTLCLVHSGRSPEAQVEIERYFQDFPAARETRLAQRIQKRVRPQSSPSRADAAGSKATADEARNQPKSRGKDQPFRQLTRQDIPVPQDPVERNLRGHALEREGLVENAIEFYQANVCDGFEGNFPYDRLAIIFRKRDDFASEIIVLKRAIEIFSALRNSPRKDVLPKLAHFTTRLFEAEKLAEKSGISG